MENFYDRISPNEILEAPSTFSLARIHHDGHADSSIHDSDPGRIRFYTLLSIFALVAILNRLFVPLHLIKSLYMAMDVSSSRRCSRREMKLRSIFHFWPRQCQ